MTDKTLLIIDLQKQFADNNEEYHRCIDYIKESASNYNHIIATIFCQNENNINYKRHLKWNGCSDSSFDDLEFFDNLKKSDNLTIIEKSGYGFSKLSLEQFMIALPQSLNTQIDIIGCDADACVMAICFQLWDLGYTNFRILTDYIYTTADESYGITREIWINIMRRNFGDCVIVPKRRLSY